MPYGAALWMSSFSGHCARHGGGSHATQHSDIEITQWGDLPHRPWDQANLASDRVSTTSSVNLLGLFPYCVPSVIGRV